MRSAVTPGRLLHACAQRAKRASRHELYLREQVQAQKRAQAKVKERIQANRRKADANFEATYRDLIVRLRVRAARLLRV